MADTSKDTRVGSSPFRQSALDRLDVAVQIDNQLPLVPRRIWLVVAGCVVLIVAGVLWAAFTPSQTSINSSGRVVAPGGLTVVSAPVTGTIASKVPLMGMRVPENAQLLTISDGTRSWPVSTMSGGEVWQDLVSLGQGVQQGQQLLTIIPDGSDRTVVAQIPEDQATPLQVGQRAYIQSPEILSGTVTALQAPLPGNLVGPRIGLELPAGQLYVLATISLDSPAHPGELVGVRIVLTDDSVLGRLLAR
jgi:hypothetical protein